MNLSTGPTKCVTWCRSMWTAPSIGTAPLAARGLIWPLGLQRSAFWGDGCTDVLMFFFGGVVVFIRFQCFQLLKPYHDIGDNRFFGRRCQLHGDGASCISSTGILTAVPAAQRIDSIASKSRVEGIDPTLVTMLFAVLVACCCFLLSVK